MAFDDALAGNSAPCPQCGRALQVPIPRELLATDAAARPRQCPRCQAEAAPTARLCHRCLTDLATGQRLPLKQRLRYVKPQTWAIAVVVTAAAIAFIVTGADYVLSLSRRTPPAQPPTPTTMTAATSPAGQELAKSLLEARSGADRLTALEALRHAGPDAAGSLGQLIASQEELPVTPVAVKNMLAAVRLVGESGDARWTSALERLGEHPELRDATVVARGQLGDIRVAQAVAQLWLVQLRTRLFAARLKQIASDGDSSVDRALLDRLRADEGRYADCLRRLGENPDARVMELLLEHYWNSREWLGQEQAERFSAEVWELAKPPRERDLDFKWRVRAARSVLDRTSQRGSPSARAAAGLVLENSGPQYATLLREIIGTLARMLSEAPPLDQQRITWTLGQLAGQPFAGGTNRAAPEDVDRKAVLAALEWARHGGIANPPPLRTSDQSYPPAPALLRHVVTPQRQLERDLLLQFAAGWREAGHALDRWQDADLGFTPRLAEILRPAYERHSDSAVAAAMILAAIANADGMRNRLELWRQSADYPAWARGMAFTALGVLDARSGRWTSGWPEGLTPEALGELGGDGPPAEFWGRLVAAGGSALKKRLADVKPSSLPAAWRDKLLQAGEQAARRRSKD